jgi:hypothetical protein
MKTTKSRTVWIALAALTLSLTTLAFTQQPPPPGEGRPAQVPPGQGEPGRGAGQQGPPRGPGGPIGPGGGQGRGVSIEGSMKQIRRAMTQLQSQITDASKKNDNIKLINDMQRGCVLAKGQPLPPDRVEGAKDDAAKAKLNDTFHAEMRKSLRLMLDIEEDLIVDHFDAAKSKLDQIQKLRDDGHRELGVEEEQERPRE